MECKKLNVMTDFEYILSRIINREHIAPSELLPYLCLESREQRCEINAMLALAYYRTHTTEHLQQAKVFIQRAWILSGFSADLLPLYIKIYSALDDTAGIREAYKRLGMKAAAEGNISEAIRYFNLWQNAYAIFNHVDRYEYDFDIIDSLDRLAEPYKFDPALPTESLHNRKIRLAYLMKGLTDVNSVLMKINILFARAHDKSRFDISFFALESDSSVFNSLQGRDHLKLIRSSDCNVVLAPDLDSAEERLLALTKSIYETKPDILITSITLADFYHYFITSLRPAPVLIGFNMGPPPQFVSPNLDGCISWTKHPLIDSPVSCSLVNLEVELPKRSDIAVFSKEELNLPENTCILASGGRPQKFQDKEFWKALLEILYDYPDVYYLAMGVQEYQIPFLKNLLSPEIRTRIRFLGWRGDYIRILGMANIVIDTYPSGSGVVLFDAMAMNIPVVSFENNYLRSFDQRDWSVAEEVMNVSDLIVPRADFKQFKRVIARLIEDEEYRTDVGHRCRKNILQKHGAPERMVQRCEEIYIKILENKLNNNISINSSGVACLQENKIELALRKFKIEDLREQNFEEWQKAYLEGYNEVMGDHRPYFYNRYIEEIGFYREVTQAKKIVEFAPGNGEFFEKFIKDEPEKEFFLVDISESNLEYLRSKFSTFSNVTYILNNQREIPIAGVDTAFSFLLCQSVPKSLWTEHLAQINEMLIGGGSYFFQFAYHPNRVANDSIPDSIAGSQIYSADEMLSLVKRAGFQSVVLTEAIDLEPFKTDMLWYLCKAIK